MFWQIFLAFALGLVLGLSPLVVMCIVSAWKIKAPDKDWQDRR